MTMRFGAVLGRLLAHRAKNPADLAHEAGLADDELTEVLAGGPIEPSLLHALAPALGLHVADVYVIAGLDLPADLAPASTSPWDVKSILDVAYRLTSAARRHAHDVILSMPAAALENPPQFERADASQPGGLPIRLLINRNIRPWCAQPLATIGDGPYVSDSTVWAVGQGRVELTPRYVIAFSRLLGLAPGDLAAMTGVAVPDDTPPASPEAVEVGRMAWDARRLDNDQMTRVHELISELWRGELRS